MLLIKLLSEMCQMFYVLHLLMIVLVEEKLSKKAVQYMISYLDFKSVLP